MRMIREKGFFKNSILLLFDVCAILIHIVYHPADKRCDTGPEYAFHESPVYASCAVNDRGRHYSLTDRQCETRVFLLITVPILLLFLLWVLKRGGALFRSVQKRLDQVNTIMQENLTAIKLIKALLRANHEVKRFLKSNTKLMEKTVSAFRLVEAAMPILMLLMNSCILFILWFGAKSIAQGGAQVGDVVSVINYATRITGALSVLPFLIMVFSRAKASGERIGEVLETEGGEGTGHDPARALAGGIEFREVSFRYPDMEKTRCITCPFLPAREKRLPLWARQVQGNQRFFS